MRNQTCCFTGHRNIPVELRSPISEILKTTIISCIEQGYLYFGAGGALGFDTLAAQTVLDLKCLYPSIKLILVLPCRDQASRWTTDDKTVYKRIKQTKSFIPLSTIIEDVCINEIDIWLIAVAFAFAILQKIQEELRIQSSMLYHKG